VEEEGQLRLAGLIFKIASLKIEAMFKLLPAMGTAVSQRKFMPDILKHLEASSIQSLVQKG